MNPPLHPGLRFEIGDIVIPVKRYHPIVLRPDPYLSVMNWETCPIWNVGVPGVVLELKVDYDSIGEVMLKVMTHNATGWVDWWSVQRFYD